MKQKLFTLFILCCLCVGNAWGDTVTMAYTNTSTTNMSGGNDAKTVGLDENSWSVVGDKGGNSNYPGLNKAGQIRLYGATTNHNFITVSATNGQTINSIKVTYGTSNYNAVVTVDGETVTGTGSDSEKTYAISGSSFTITHNYSGNTQVYILSIEITYTGGKTLNSLAISGTPTKTTYESGEEFDPAGLVVTGTYSDSSTDATLADKATWTIDPATLSEGMTSVDVIATVSGVSSTKYTVTGLTVNAHTVTPGQYDIVPNNAFWGTSYGGSSNCGLTLEGSQDDITVSTDPGTSTSGYVKDTETRVYNGYTLTLSVPEGYAMTAITFTGSTWKQPTASVGTISFKAWTGAAQEVTFTFSGTSYMTKISVSYYNTKDVTVTSAGWATVCLPFNAKISSDNATAYYVTTSNGKIVKTEVDVVEAGAGFLLGTEDGNAATVTFVGTAETPDDAANEMVGSLEGETFKEANTTYYVLSSGDKGVGFYWDVNTNDEGASAICGAGKAVLAIEGASSAKALSLVDDAAGISNITTATANAKRYSITGVNVAEGYKGITIINGKKFVNK